MKARAFATLSVLALATAFAPLTALPAKADTLSYDLQTRRFDAMSAGEYDGRLKLRIASDGIVFGNFLDDSGHLTPVTGGLSGTKIWFQIGRGRIYNGTFVDGKLLASASGDHGLRSWTFEGTPAKHS